MHTARYPQKPDIGRVCDRGLDDFYTTRNIWTIVCNKTNETNSCGGNSYSQVGTSRFISCFLMMLTNFQAVATCDILQICKEPLTAANLVVLWGRSNNDLCDGQLS